MNMHSSFRTGGSLLERAAEVYDFGASLRAPAIPQTAPAPAEPACPEERQEAAAPEPETTTTAIALVPQEHDETETELLLTERPDGVIDREGLLAAGLILPEAPVTGLAEEFRIIKRQLLIGVGGGAGIAEGKRQTILVCSARADEGKTFCAVNLALSLATEKDLEVLLVDGDFVKPEIPAILGLNAGPGLVDAIADPAADAEDFVIRTDLGSLSVLPAGRQANNVTELLSSGRTRDVLAGLTRNRPRRVVIFDSPPALLASPATVLATHVGQVMMVVRADRTTEADLKEAVALLSGCEQVSLMLNGTGFAAGGPRFGSYYGYGK